MKLSNPITLGKQPSLTILRLIAMQMTVALLVCLSLGQSTTAWAQEGVTVRPDPLLLEIGVGSTGVVNILVEDVTDLYGFEFAITFDSTVLEVIDADPDEEGVQIQSGDFLSPDWLLDNTVDNNNGTIAYALCQMSPSEPQSGNGVLAIITWRGKAVGTSPIHFIYVKLGATRGIEIPANAEDGQIVVVSADAAPADTPTPTAAPTETPTPLPTTPAPTSTPILPTSAPTSTPIPPTPTPIFTRIPPTSTPPATAVLEATEPPTAMPTSTPSSTATPMGVPTLTSTSVATATLVPEAVETPLPTATAIQPTSTAVSTATAQAMSTQQTEASPTPSTPTPISSSNPSGISASSLIYIALACLLPATLGIWLLWKRRK